MGWGSKATAPLSLWLSKLHACRGWLAGWLPEKPVGMQGQGWGRRLLPSVLTNKPAVFFSVLECILQNCFSCKTTCYVSPWFGWNRWHPAAFHGRLSSGLAETLNGQQPIKAAYAPPPILPTRHLKSPSCPPTLAPSPTSLLSTYRGLVLVSFYSQLSFILSCPVLLFERL